LSILLTEGRCSLLKGSDVTHYTLDYSASRLVHRLVQQKHNTGIYSRPKTQACGGSYWADFTDGEHMSYRNHVTTGRDPLSKTQCSFLKTKRGQHNDATAPSRPRLFHYRGFTITLRHTTIGRILRTSDQLVAETSICTTHNTHKTQASMPPAGLEPAIPASERPETHVLDCTATGVGEV